MRNSLRESTSDRRWIPITKGTVMRIAFPLHGVIMCDEKFLLICVYRNIFTKSMRSENTSPCRNPHNRTSPVVLCMITRMSKVICGSVACGCICILCHNDDLFTNVLYVTWCVWVSVNWSCYSMMKFVTMMVIVCCRADSRLAPSQWETSWQGNVASHYLGANLESAL